MKFFVLFVALVMPIQVVAGGAKPPPVPGKSQNQVQADSITKDIGRKMQSKARDLAIEARKNVSFMGATMAADDALSKFIEWIRTELTEAFSVQHDLSDLVASAKVVFSSACSNDLAKYTWAWSRFLSITLKYGASIGCSFVEPIFLPPLCYFIGHVTGKYLGQAIGKAVWNASCSTAGITDNDIRALAEVSEKELEQFDPYTTIEYEQFKAQF